MKKVFSIVLILTFLLPSFSMANGIMEQKNLDANITRKELATIGIRLTGNEHIAKNYNGRNKFKDVKGWSLAYVNVASDIGLMLGTSKDRFKPDKNLTYIELLTVLMRTLGYEDGIDFQSYPENYHSKALEIGLADLYIPYDKVVTRGETSKTIDKALTLVLKDEAITLAKKLNKHKPDIEDNNKNIKLEDISFNTSIVGMFSGQAKGYDDFTGFKIELLSQKGDLYKSTLLDKSGAFSMENFTIDILAKIIGYKYKVYDKNNNLILEKNL